MTRHFDLAVAWDWEYDKEFIGILEAQLHSRDLLFYSVSHHNVTETLEGLRKGSLRFGAFLDRASDSDETFEPLAKYMRRSNTLLLNRPEAVHHGADKATMHMALLAKGVHVPFTIIISPFNKRQEIELSLTDLAHLGRPFIIKPANTTGGGTGVITGAETLKDVIDSRQHHKNDKYLLQEKIEPAFFNGRKGWFRVLCMFGRPFPCWWDDATHVYTVLTEEERIRYRLRPLVTQTRLIHEVCDLDFFSTEIAATNDRRFVSVDYVNEVCDMRLQSLHADGVPDALVEEMCNYFARSLKSALNQ
ncbi:MAG: hypothetical protein OEV30_11255 [Ignavibacteria bacterium]|nr:hypothetical protein [Ignavibacteria bacterium]